MNHHTSSSVNNGHTGLSLLGHGGSTSSGSSSLVTGSLAYSSLYGSSSHAQQLQQHVSSTLSYHPSSHLHTQSGSVSAGLSSPSSHTYYDILQHMSHTGSHHGNSSIQVTKAECPSPSGEHHSVSNRSPVLMTSHSPGNSDLNSSPHIVNLGNNNNNNKVVVMGNENMERPTVVSMSS
jgi:hypothetical protein